MFNVLTGHENVFCIFFNYKKSILSFHWDYLAVLSLHINDRSLSLAASYVDKMNHSQFT